MANNNVCGSGIPSDEVWYKANEVTYPFRPYNQGNTWFWCNPDGTGTNNYILSNTYDSTDGWYKIKWNCDFVSTAGSGWLGKDNITEVILPDSLIVEGAENWISCSGITKLTYGNSVEELQEGACPPNVTDIYIYATTPPYLRPDGNVPSRGDYFRIRNYYSHIHLTIHAPIGSDYSNWTIPSYATIVYDLCDSPTPTPTNILYPEKWKVGTDTTVKAYSGSNEVKKMYIGENLVYREQTYVEPPTIDYKIIRNKPYFAVQNRKGTTYFKYALYDSNGNLVTKTNYSEWVYEDYYTNLTSGYNFAKQVTTAYNELDGMRGKETVGIWEQ